MGCRKKQTGNSLAELTVVLAVIGLIAMIGVSALTRAASRAAVRGAALRVKAVLIETREQAIDLDHNCGVKFQRSGATWMYSIHDDGNGNGVRNEDIASGIDPIIAGPFALLPGQALATVRLPRPGAADPDTGLAIDAGSASVQFNRSTICAFAPDGDGTPGTVFITANDGQSAFVRCAGEGGNIRVAYYDPATRKWQ
jgi:type II secretory pathway pseudopilin PulG